VTVPRPLTKRVILFTETGEFPAAKGVVSARLERPARFTKLRVRETAKPLFCTFDLRWKEFAREPQKRSRSGEWS
jgi:hypothetical protein